MSDPCARVHEWFKRSRRFSFPFNKNELPKNGLYVLFERGEIGHGGDRIVRVGTHTGKNQIRSRLKQHFMTKNKDRSIFRKNIGRCLLNRENDPYLTVWNLDLTTRIGREQHGHLLDKTRQGAIENQVSDFIQSNLSFSVVEIQSKEERLALESRLISTISLCEDCNPSSSWMGLHSPKQKIRESGLWQVNELYKARLNKFEMNRLRGLLTRSESTE